MGKVESEWVLPTENFYAHPGYAGVGSVFFLDKDGGCENCKVSPTFDVFVDITNGLQKNQIRRTDCVLKVVIQYSDDTVVPLDQTKIPSPLVKGPRFRQDFLQEAGKPNDEDEVKAL